jgi:hypothetical protein
MLRFGERGLRSSKSQVIRAMIGLGPIRYGFLSSLHSNDQFAERTFARFVVLVSRAAFDHNRRRMKRNWRATSHGWRFNLTQCPHDHDQLERTYVHSVGRAAVGEGFSNTHME